MKLSTKRLRVRLRQVRYLSGDLWAQSIDPVDRFVARVVLRSQLAPAAQVKLIHAWLALR